MEDQSSRLFLIAIGILIVGLVVGYSIGRSGISKARSSGTKKLKQARASADKAEDDLATCKKTLKAKPPSPGQAAIRRHEAILRLTEAELSIRSENLGDARTKLELAKKLIEGLAGQSPNGTAKKALGTFGARLDKIRESTLRMDARDPRATARVAQSIRDLRNTLVYRVLPGN